MGGVKPKKAPKKKKAAPKKKKTTKKRSIDRKKAVRWTEGCLIDRSMDRWTVARAKQTSEVGFSLWAQGCVWSERASLSACVPRRDPKGGETSVCHAGVVAALLLRSYVRVRLEDPLQL